MGLTRFGHLRTRQIPVIAKSDQVTNFWTKITLVLVWSDLVNTIIFVWFHLIVAGLTGYVSLIDLVWLGRGFVHLVWQSLTGFVVVFYGAVRPGLILLGTKIDRN